MFFRQIKYRGDNFSYIIADESIKEAAIIDPSFNAEAIIRLVEDEDFDVKYVVNTHSHVDHTAGNEEIVSKFKAKIVAHKSTKGNNDIGVVDGDVLKLGTVIIKVMHTPGHTPDSICLLVDGKLLTGDTLFIGECGRTDLPGGSAEEMYDSLLHKLMMLEDSVEVYPGHDYGSTPHSTIGIEKRTNYTMQKRSLREFINFMGTT